MARPFLRWSSATNGMIELIGVSKHFGGVRAVEELDLKVEHGQVLGLIGPNGSGKSTTLDLIAGQRRSSAGRIVLGGRDVSGAPVHERARDGVARTFQHSRLFSQLTVRDNLRAALAGCPGAPGDVARALRAFDLHHREDDLAAELSGPERRRLELARATVSRPRLLLLDEPAAGMDALEIRRLRDWITGLRRAGTAILLVEHVLELVMAVADRIAVLDFGRKIAEGVPSEIRNDAAVRRAYLGGGAR
jgi:ABC-type branched-subunit amino acid transport system ATPase component